MIEKLRNQIAIAKDDQGLSTVEYIIILGLIAVVGIGAWTTFGEAVTTEVGEAEGAINVVTP